MGWLWDTITLMVLSAISVIPAWIFMLGHELEYMATPVTVPEFTKPAPAEKALPTIRNMGNPMYAADTDKVVIDIERIFARALMEFPDDLTENKWLDSGIWKSWGGAGRDQFTDVLKKWKAEGIIARRGTAKNAKYYVVSKGRLARVAGGR